MARDPHHLAPEVLVFLAERHLATLTTLRPDGTPQGVAVGFSWDDEAGLVRVITNGTSHKAAHVRAGSPRAVVAQIDGPRWLSLEAAPTVSDDPARVAAPVRRHALLGVGWGVRVPAPAELALDPACAAHRLGLRAAARVLHDEPARDVAGRRVAAHRDPEHDLEAARIFHTKRWAPLPSRDPGIGAHGGWRTRPACTPGCARSAIPRDGRSERVQGCPVT